MPSKEEVVEALRQVEDPELGMDIVELGLFYDAEIEQAQEHGIEDIDQIFTIDDLVPQEVIVVATGVSNGDLLRGVRFLGDSARTHSLVMCTRCNWVRFVDGIHFFARDRREEVRLN